MAAKVSDEIRKLIYGDPDMPADAIVAKLADQGLKTTEASVQSYRSDFLGTIKVLTELGAFNVVAPKAKPKAKRVRSESRASRWASACADAQDALGRLKDLQGEYEEWKDNLPENLQQSPVGEKLEAVCDLDISGAEDMVGEAEGLDLPMGFGRD